MERIIDLHTHSTASDGSMRPGELIRHAKHLGLSAVALTDHDTMDGLEEALAEGARVGVKVIPGVEIGIDYKTEMHMLGYFREDNYKNFEEVLKRLRKSRNDRNPKIINKLNEMGFTMTTEDVEQEAAGAVIGRPHIAKVLLKKGYVGSFEEAFEKYLSEESPAYFKKDKLTPEQGIQEILRAGGIPVIAHPIFLRLEYPGLDELLTSLTAVGLRGIEAYYVENTIHDTGCLLRLAIKRKLLITGGSDFHGSFKEEIMIGTGRGNLKVPYSLLAPMGYDE